MADQSVKKCPTCSHPCPDLQASLGERLPPRQTRDPELRRRAAATEWATAGRSIRQRRIVAALIVSSEAWPWSEGTYKIREASLSAKEGSGSGCALPHRPPCLRRRPVLPSRKPGVLGSRTLRRTEHVHLRSEPLWLPGGTTMSTISRRRLVHNAGWQVAEEPFSCPPVGGAPAWGGTEVLWTRQNRNKQFL